jgi:hypothetical protein
VTSPLFSASIFTFLPPGDCPTTHLLLLWVPSQDRTELTQVTSELYYDRRSVLVCLGVRHSCCTRDQFSFLLYSSIFRQLRVCWCGAPSLTRKQVCSFQFLLGISSATFLRSESDTHEHILLSLFLRLPQPGRPGSCIYFPQEQGGPVIPAVNGYWTNWSWS